MGESATDRWSRFSGHEYRLSSLLSADVDVDRNANADPRPYRLRNGTRIILTG